MMMRKVGWEFLHMRNIIGGCEIEESIPQQLVLILFILVPSPKFRFFFQLILSLSVHCGISLLSDHKIYLIVFAQQKLFLDLLCVTQ